MQTHRFCLAIQDCLEGLAMDDQASCRPAVDRAKARGSPPVD